jgi:hypothetical protein
LEETGILRFVPVHVPFFGNMRMAEGEEVLMHRRKYAEVVGRNRREMIYEV